MKLNPLFLVCVLCVIVAIALFTVVAVQQEFHVFKPSNQTSSVGVSQDVGAEDSRFMWNNDALALIAQAFVLLAAAAATLGLLRNGDEKHA